MSLEIKSDQIQLDLHDHPPEAIEKAKYLGLTIRKDLKWKSDVNNVCAKANNTLGLLRRNLNISSTSIKEQAYKSLIKPSLMYAFCSLVPYNKDINDLTQGCQVCYKQTMKHIEC